MSGSVDNLIKSDVSIVLKVFLLLSVSWCSLRAFPIRQRERAVHLLGLSILEGQFYCHPQTFPITGRLGNVIVSMTLG